MADLNDNPKSNGTGITDLSPHVVQLSRMIDRLPPGTYEITLRKEEFRQKDWSVEIVRTEKIVGISLSAKSISD